MAAKLKQRDISWNNKLRENMSPTKVVMIMLVQSMKGVTKKTGVVDIEVTQGYFSEIGNYNI